MQALQLQELGLGYTAVTDKGLLQLAGLKQVMRAGRGGQAAG